MAHIAGLAGDAKGELTALTRAFDADKKNSDILATLAERAEVAGDLDMALKALRLIIANNAGGAISVPDAFLRQARIVHRRGEPDRAIMFARRAAQEAQKGDPIDRAARRADRVAGWGADGAAEEGRLRGEDGDEGGEDETGTATRTRGSLFAGHEPDARARDQRCRV